MPSLSFFEIGKFFINGSAVINSPGSITLTYRAVRNRVAVSNRFLTPIKGKRQRLTSQLGAENSSLGEICESHQFRFRLPGKYYEVEPSFLVICGLSFGNEVTQEWFAILSCVTKGRVRHSGKSPHWCSKTLFVSHADLFEDFRNWRSVSWVI